MISVPIVTINRTDTLIRNNLTIGMTATPSNITMFSPDGTKFKCGVNDGGTFSCS